VERKNVKRNPLVPLRGTMVRLSRNRIFDSRTEKNTDKTT
jgi:hypothetical protein